MTGPITRRQSAALHANLAELGVDRALKLRFCSAVLYRDVDSTRDLSVDDARAVLGVLDGVTERHRSDPMAGLMRLITETEAVRA